ncbi:MAG: hypothetical protein ACRDYD_01810 [Acidimicrobiales bacterium]
MRGVAVPPAKQYRWALRVVAVTSLLGMGAVHLYLYLGQGYRHIPTVGSLFLFTVVFAFALGGIFAIRPHWILGLIGAGFAFSTLGAYVLTLVLPHGLFQFSELGVSAAGGVSIAFEVIGGLALLSWPARWVAGTSRSGAMSRTDPRAIGDPLSSRHHLPGNRND